MIALIRRLLRFIKKDQRLLTNYQRSHPHFFGYIALDAVLSVALVVGAYQLVGVDSSTAEKLLHMGTTVVTSDELIKHAKDDDVDAFWLGPVSGYQYSLNHEVTGIADLFYWPISSGNRDVKVFLYEVKTYKNQEVWDDHTHTILATADTKTIVINKDLSIRINPSSMKGVIATYGDKPEIVAIAYPTPQSLQAMIKNVESLKPVQ